jgi:hypothetical protein
MVRTRSHKYWILNKGEPREMLVDMAHDPGEMVNLASSPDPRHQAQLKRHRDILQGWSNATGDKCPLAHWPGHL